MAKSCRPLEALLTPGVTRREEKEQCERMHRLIEELNLDGDLRWLVAQKNRVRNGELYRLIADSHGAFVQPALYEAFGLTVR